MGKIIAVANLKGGVGKSTLAVNLACALAEDSKHVLIVDADSQGTSCFWNSQGKLPVEVKGMPLDDRTASSGWFSRLLADRESDDRARVKRWKRDLRNSHATYVIVDCPPHIGLATTAALDIADLVIMPVTPSAADLVATATALELLGKARAKRKDKGPRCLLVPSRVDRSTSTGKQIEGVMKKFGQPLGPSLCQRVAFADAIAFGQWVGDYAPKGPAHYETTTLARAVRAALARDPSAAAPTKVGSA